MSTWRNVRREERRRLSADRLVLAELDRHADDNSQRQANIIARVSIAMAMNGVVLVPLFADGLGILRTWPGVLWLLPLVPAVLSIAFGFRSVHLWMSKGAELTSGEIAVWRTKGTEALILDRLIRDRLEMLEAARTDLQTKIRWHQRSTQALVWTGCSMLAVFLSTTWIGLIR